MTVPFHVANILVVYIITGLERWNGMAEWNSGTCSMGSGSLMNGKKLCIVHSWATVKVSMLSVISYRSQLLEIADCLQMRNLKRLLHSLYGRFSNDRSASCCKHLGSLGLERWNGMVEWNTVKPPLSGLP